MLRHPFGDVTDQLSVVLNTRLRAEAVEAFAHIGSEKALPYLREALELRELRAEALRGLARIGSPASIATSG